MSFVSSQRPPLAPQVSTLPVDASRALPFAPLALTGRAVLVATDGSPGAAAAARVALGLETAYAANVHVINVVDTRSAPMPPPLDKAIAFADAIGGSAAREQQAQEIRAALSAETGRTIEWPVEIKLGTPAKAIVDEATRIGAALVVVGLRRHGRIDRVLNDETTLEVMRHATCPVLGVVAGTTTLPVRVLAALDFSKTSLMAAHAARSVSGTPVSFVLAYVATLTAFLPDDGELLIHNLGVDAAFEQAEHALGRDGVMFKRVVLRRDTPQVAAEMLLELAAETQCDLIAAGSARHDRVDRWLIGSCSAELVRDGGRSVLIVPPLRDPA